MSMISDLPEDLLREIVCRVPLRDMLAVRRTCKRWDTLSKTDIFRKMHVCNEAAREAGESRMVMMMGFNLHLISVFVADVEHPSTYSRGKLVCSSLNDSYQRISKVYHCDGLLLCLFKYTFKLVVWNPYLGQRRWITPPSYSYCDICGWDRYMYALGYDNEKKSHKILRFIDDRILEKLGQHFLCYEMYDFDCDSWRTLDVGTPHWEIFFHTSGVPLSGNTYWLARHRKSDYDGSDRLICFDFTSETFGSLLPLPLPSEENRVANALLSCLKGEKLSLLLQLIHPCELDIWVTDPNNVSWSNFFKIDTGPAVGIGYSDSGFFIDEERKVAMGFDKISDTRHTLNVIGEDGFFTKVDVDTIIKRDGRGYMSHEHAHVCSYVPSLVQVQIQKPPSRAFIRVFKRTRRT